MGETGDPAQGIAALERADQIDPDRGDVLSGLVALCAQSKDRAKAEAAARRAEALKQPALSERVRESLARLDVMEAEDAARAKDYAKAVALLRAARDRTARDDLKSRIDDADPGARGHDVEEEAGDQALALRRDVSLLHAPEQLVTQGLSVRVPGRARRLPGERRELLGEKRAEQAFDESRAVPRSCPS